MSEITEHRKGEFTVSTDRARLDLGCIHGFLREAYWSEAIPREVVAKSLDHSLCFGLYDGARQVGFARVVTDYATFAWLGDVFVLETHRGRGLSKWLMDCVMAHPELRGLRRFLLATRDAHGLYGQFGFKPLAAPEIFMEVHDPAIYTRSAAK